MMNIEKELGDLYTYYQDRVNAGNLIDTVNKVINTIDNNEDEDIVAYLQEEGSQKLIENMRRNAESSRRALDMYIEMLQAYPDFLVQETTHFDGRQGMPEEYIFAEYGRRTGTEQNYIFREII